MSGVQGGSPVAQSFALPCRSRSWFRCPASGRFGPSAQQPTGLTLPLRACRGLGQRPKLLCRSTKRERFEWPKVTRNAASF